MRPLPDDLAALKAGGKGALARVLSALETDADAPALASLLDAAIRAPRGVALGLTGPPGVGKSTLTNVLVARLRADRETVAVIAVDPSSRRSGGAILGDRTRIATDPEDAGAFVRSMAAGDRLGGLASITFPATVLMRALFDWVLVETVGVGQSETEIADCADLVVLCLQPGSGDALQFMKAGVMEVPDIVLVTKGDMGGPARRAASEARGALSLSDPASTPSQVHIVSAQTGEGLDTALAGIREHAARLAGSGDVVAGRDRQSRKWIQSRIADSYGRFGLDAIAPYLDAGDAPFQSVSDLSGRLRAALDLVIKNL